MLYNTRFIFLFFLFLFFMQHQYIPLNPDNLSWHFALMLQLIIWWHYSSGIREYFSGWSFFSCSINIRINNLLTIPFIIFQSFTNTQMHGCIKVYIWWTSTTIQIHFSLWHPKWNMGIFINQILKHARKAFFMDLSKLWAFLILTLNQKFAFDSHSDSEILL